MHGQTTPSLMSLHEGGGPLLLPSPQTGCGEARARNVAQSKPGHVRLAPQKSFARAVWPGPAYVPQQEHESPLAHGRPATSTTLHSSKAYPAPLGPPAAPELSPALWPPRVSARPPSAGSEGPASTERPPPASDAELPQLTANPASSSAVQEWACICFIDPPTLRIVPQHAPRRSRCGRQQTARRTRCPIF